MSEQFQEPSQPLTKPKKSKKPKKKCSQNTKAFVGVPTAPRFEDADYRAALTNPDTFAIGNKRPDREYRFVSKKVLDKSGGFDRRGWEPLTAQNNQGERLVSSFGTVSSGTDLRNGDLVACFMPKERAEIKRARLALARNKVRESLDRFKKTADRLGALEKDKTHVSIHTVGRQGRSEYDREDRIL